MFDTSDNEDNRPVETLRLGGDWKPSLADVMKDYPWPETVFVYAPPAKLPENFDPAVDAVEKLAQWKASMSGIPTVEAHKAWQDIHAVDLMRVLDILGACGVKVAEDINRLGCTGVIAHAGHTIDDVKFLRIGLAGSGVGLPCFVPPMRYCLAHTTIGGLEHGQKAHYQEYVETISRDLTPQEHARVELIEKMRHADGDSLADRLRKTHAGIVAGERQIMMTPDIELPVMPDAPPVPRQDVVPGREASALHAPGMTPYRPQDNFTCIDHEQKHWTCRFCVAEMIVQGDLVPTFRLADSMSVVEIAADAIDPKIAELDNVGSVVHVAVLVQVARYRRKLARD